MKFSTKQGSAVVHYKSGQKFHISYLTYMAVVGNKILITREYTKDGMEFTQSVYVPFEMFDKVIFQRKHEEMVITLDKLHRLSYTETQFRKEIFFN